VVSFRVADGLVKVTLHYLQKLERYDARRPSLGSPRGLRTATLKMDIPNGEPQACPSNRVIRPLLTAIAG